MYSAKTAHGIDSATELRSTIASISCCFNCSAAAPAISLAKQLRKGLGFRV